MSNATPLTPLLIRSLDFVGNLLITVLSCFSNLCLSTIGFCLSAVPSFSHSYRSPFQWLSTFFPPPEFLFIADFSCFFLAF